MVIMHPALILAGGASSRMGRNKATVLVDGVAMIVRVAHALRDAGCRPIYIAVRDMFQRQEVLAVLGHLTDVECVLDTVLERGARSGLTSGLKMCQDLGVERLQLAPCDVPWINSQVFERLSESCDDVVMPKGKQLQPLLSLVKVDPVLSALQRFSSEMALKDVMRGVPYKIINFDENGGFRNVNSQSDLR